MINEEYIQRLLADINEAERKAKALRDEAEKKEESK